MNIKKLVLALSCISMMTVVQAADTDRHYPAPSTVSEQMAALVNAPVPALWYSDPKTLQDWEQMAGSRLRALSWQAFRFSQNNHEGSPLF